jgi:Glutamyl-tRNAGlu reductase, N-terminal domain/Shikimate / quinate 5-dehydrogenase
MVFKQLFVVHQRKHGKPAAGAFDAFRADEERFCIETCLRRLLISHAADSTRAGASATDQVDVELVRGIDAYDLLLRIASGLESEVPGESEVFGQFKQSWQTYRTEHAETSRRLDPLMRKLFEDVKEIRSRHLTGLGAATYGSLVRALLGANADQPTLLIGAGEMAAAILPYLAGRPLYIANRTPEHATALLTGMRRQADRADQIHLIGSKLDAELAAWRTATNVVVCVPPNRERDVARVQAWKNRDSKSGHLLHLGKLTPGDSLWAKLDRFATLVDLFALQSANSERRRVQLLHARNACRERAQLRGLGGGAGVAHGWEDLALFAHSA